MNSKITSLANLIQAKRQAEQKFAVMLGAGASISSGVKPTEALMTELVGKYGQHLGGEDLRERFDKLWSSTPEQTRDVYLRPYLDQRPSPGYGRLAGLLRDGYCDLVITFNYDNLVEAALSQAGLRAGFEFQVIIRGDHKDERVASMMGAKDPRIKILKLHGSLRSGNTFLFSEEEMSNYPEPIEQLVAGLTRQGMIVCGYGFADMCVMRAFASKGDSIYCVNPKAPPNLKSFLVSRRSTDNVIDKEDGYFDNFFEQLHGALNRAGPEPQRKPEINPFKFLDSYDASEKEWFLGRRGLTRRVLQKLNGSGCAAIHIVGPEKVGKTSLVRAGILARLDPERYFPVYLRCRPDLERCLPEFLRERLGLDLNGSDLATTLRRLAAARPQQRVILILDQFERVARRYQDNEAGRKELRSCLQTLCQAGGSNLTVVLVAVDDVMYVKQLVPLGSEMIDVPRLEARRVGRIVRLLARGAGIRLDPQVIEAMTKRYMESVGSLNPFTLAHLQALGNLLCTKTHVDLAAYEEALGQHLEGLDRAINRYDILSSVEDCPLEEQRVLLRNILKIVSPSSRQGIAEFLRDHFTELLGSPARRRPTDARPVGRSGANAGG